MEEEEVDFENLATLVTSPVAGQRKFSRLKKVCVPKIPPSHKNAPVRQTIPPEAGRTDGSDNDSEASGTTPPNQV
jgi:hypothetical protein